MIDTVVLMLSKDMYEIIDPDKFTPSARCVLNNNPLSSSIRSKQNPTKRELLAGIYKPRLTLFHRVTPSSKLEAILGIEISLPKLLFGNNFDELMVKDFKPLLEKLSAVLLQMGVIVTPTKLAKAPVSSIHYSKNIPLTDGSTPYHYINKIKEANIKLTLDVNETDYRNSGHCFKWHCNSYEVVFYDKIHDLEKAKLSDKRALEKDSGIQLNIFEKLQQRNKFEVLRMEVRLNKRKKIKQLFNTLSIKSDLTLRSLFKVSIAKKILLHYLDEIESKRSALLDYKIKSDKGLIADLIFNNPALTPKQVMQMYGFKKALELVNTRELRAMFVNSNQRSWYRLIADANKIILPNIQKPLDIIREKLLKFEPLNIKKIRSK